MRLTYIYVTIIICKLIIMKFENIRKDEFYMTILI